MQRNEQLRIQCRNDSEFEMGYFRHSNGDLIATKRVIVLDRKHLTRLIVSLQRFHQKVSRNDAMLVTSKE
jgi:hypothetical protein